MAKQYDEIIPEFEQFIKKQHIFFVGSAPRSDNGHVNVSPKGYDVLRILSPTEVAYLDLTGSGNETSAHLEENGRITFMFCAFEGNPLILRLFGTGHAILPGTTEWNQLVNHFDLLPGTRQIIHAKIDLVQTSCGYGVPLMDFKRDRDTLHRWAEAKGEDGIAAYHREKNSMSIDGLPTPLGQGAPRSVL